MSRPEQELLTKYLLSRLLEQGGDVPEFTTERRDDQDSASSIVYPQVVQQRVRRPLQKILDQAKDSIDVIDFRNPEKRVNVCKTFQFLRTFVNSVQLYCRLFHLYCDWSNSKSWCNMRAISVF